MSHKNTRSFNLDCPNCGNGISALVVYFSLHDRYSMFAATALGLKHFKCGSCDRAVTIDNFKLFDLLLAIIFLCFFIVIVFVAEANVPIYFVFIYAVFAPFFWVFALFKFSSLKLK